MPSKPSQTLPKAFPNSGQPFSAIFGRASGQIYRKNRKKYRKIVLFGAFQAPKRQIQAPKRQIQAPNRQIQAPNRPIQAPN